MTPAETRVRADVLRAIVGPGPAWLVRPTSPPSMAVEVSNVAVAIGASFSLSPRIDLVCLNMWDGLLRGVEVLHGSPSPCPAPPLPCSGWLPIARVRIDPFAISIDASDIEEIRP